MRVAGSNPVVRSERNPQLAGGFVVFRHRPARQRRRPADGPDAPHGEQGAAGGDEQGTELAEGPGGHAGAHQLAVVGRSRLAAAPTGAARVGRRRLDLGGAEVDGGAGQVVGGRRVGEGERGRRHLGDRGGPRVGAAEVEGHLVARPEPLLAAGAAELEQLGEAVHGDGALALREPCGDARLGRDLELAGGRRRPGRPGGAVVAHQVAAVGLLHRLRVAVIAHPGGGRHHRSGRGAPPLRLPLLGHVVRALGAVAVLEEDGQRRAEAVRAARQLDAAGHLEQQRRVGGAVGGDERHLRVEEHRGDLPRRPEGGEGLGRRPAEHVVGQQVHRLALDAEAPGGRVLHAQRRLRQLGVGGDDLLDARVGAVGVQQGHQVDVAGDRQQGAALALPVAHERLEHLGARLVHGRPQAELGSGGADRLALGGHLLPVAGGGELEVEAALLGGLDELLALRADPVGRGLGHAPLAGAGLLQLAAAAPLLGAGLPARRHLGALLGVEHAILARRHHVGPGVGLADGHGVLQLLGEAEEHVEVADVLGVDAERLESGLAGRQELGGAAPARPRHDVEVEALGHREHLVLLGLGHAEADGQHLVGQRRAGRDALEPLVDAQALGGLGGGRLVDEALGLGQVAAVADAGEQLGDGGVGDHADRDLVEHGGAARPEDAGELPRVLAAEAGDAVPGGDDGLADGIGRRLGLVARDDGPPRLEVQEERVGDLLGEPELLLG
ncbi:MAG: hypothetical protein R2711_14915 [Acidimicrobiales bacterium]